MSTGTHQQSLKVNPNMHDLDYNIIGEQQASQQEPSKNEYEILLNLRISRIILEHNIRELKGTHQ